MECRPPGRPSVSTECLNGLGGYVQIFDRKYRLFGIINLIDLLVIIAVVVAAFAVYRLLSRSKTATAGSGGVEATYTILVPTIRGITSQQVKVGDSVFKVTGKPIGTVKAVRVTPTPSEAFDPQTGTVKPFQSTVYDDVWIDVVVKGTPTDTGFAVGDLVLHGGQSVPMMTSTFEGDNAVITTLTVGGQ
jgi:Domain of unknown function (DUF4330)